MKIIITIFSLLIFTAAYSQKKIDYTPAVKEKIKQVENNLISWVKLDSNRNWNIVDRMKSYHVPGVTIAVIHNYKIEWIKSYGWADTLHKRPITSNTLFQIASIGKTLNAVGQLTLVQQGKLNLNADINKYLKRWNFPYDTISHGKKINLQELLTHSAGLSVHGFDGYNWNTQLPTIEQTLNGEKPANNPPVKSIFEPGTKFEYSGGGITISEMMLEDVTRMDYSEYMFQHVFKPLEMYHTFFSTYPPYNDFAIGSRYDGLKMENGYMRFTERACGGALWSTAEDIAKLVIELQLSLKGKSNKVLSTSAVKQMLTPVSNENSTGLGCFIVTKAGKKYFQHSGLNPGYCSQYYGSFDGNGVVVLANGDNTNFRDEVVNSVATVYGWKNFYDYAPKKIIQLPQDSLIKFIGKYRFENSDAGPEIVLENGHLYLQTPNESSKWQIYFTSAAECFMLEARWTNQIFLFKNDGKVEGFTINTGTYHSKVLKVQ